MSVRCADCKLFDMTTHPAHALVGLGVCKGDREVGKFRSANSLHAPCEFFLRKAA